MRHVQICDLDPEFSLTDKGIDGIPYPTVRSRVD